VIASHYLPSVLQQLPHHRPFCVPSGSLEDFPHLRAALEAGNKLAWLLLSPLHNHRLQTSHLLMLGLVVADLVAVGHPPQTLLLH
jgi:hypothetical protein